MTEKSDPTASADDHKEELQPKEKPWGRGNSLLFNLFMEGTAEDDANF